MKRKYNRTIRILIILLTSVVLFPACKGLLGIEKRKHLSGYHLDISKDITKEKPVRKNQYIIDTVGGQSNLAARNKTQSTKVAEVNKVKPAKENSQIYEEPNLTASSDNELTQLDFVNPIKVFTKQFPKDDPEDGEEVDDTSAYINLALDALAILTFLLEYVFANFIGVSLYFLTIPFLVLTLLAFGFSIYNLVKLSRKRKSIKKRWLYHLAIWTGFALFSIVLIAVIIVLLIVLWYMSFL